MNAFPFLRLPKELRLIVYENIPTAEQECSIRESDHQAFTLKVRTLSTNILTTCRLIHAEAKGIFGSRLKELYSGPPLLILHSDIPRYRFLKKDKFLRELIGTIDIVATCLGDGFWYEEAEMSKNNLRSGHLLPGINLSETDTACIMRFVEQSARQKFVHRGMVSPGFELHLDTTSWTLRTLTPPQNLALTHCEELHFLLSMICQTAWIYLKIGFLSSSRSDPFVYAKRCLVKDTFDACEGSWYTLVTGMDEDQEREGRELLLSQHSWPN